MSQDGAIAAFIKQEFGVADGAYRRGDDRITVHNGGGCISYGYYRWARMVGLPDDDAKPIPISGGTVS